MSNSFVLYVFSEECRADDGKGELAIIMDSPKYYDRYGTPMLTGGYNKMLYMASSIFIYDLDLEFYKVYKSRHSEYGNTDTISFREITSSVDVLYMNDYIGKSQQLCDYLDIIKSSSLKHTKFLKIDIDKLEHIEIYLSALANS